MKHLVGLVHWCVAHPETAVLLAVVLLSVLNGILPRRVQGSRPVRYLHRLLDRLSALVRRDAPGTLKLPLVAVSILEASPDPEDKPAAPSGRIPPPLPVLLLALLLAGCPQLPPPDGCRPNVTRCSPAGVPQTCSPTGRWTGLPLALPCTQAGATCCLVHGRGGVLLHACAVDRVACVPEVVDAGAVPADGGVE